MTNPAVAVNPLVELGRYGQSPWYDNIRRSLITSGELRGFVENDGLKGVTSNPAIFEKAIAGSTDYNAALQQTLARGDMDVKALYESLAIADIQAAAGVLQSVYAATNRRDGYVSLEVSPYLANDRPGTIEEARRLWKQVDRPNVMIKVPGTAEGIPAVRALIGEGINVNVTLLFSVAAYEAVVDAYMSGLEDFAARGGDLPGVASVASFFVSRIDSSIDSIAEKRLKDTTNPSEQALLRAVIGKVAIANARLAYALYRELTASSRWQALAAKGAQTQRLLWASTGTKNPAYRDVIYVEELIGPDTVNTIPAATFDAFRAHGVARASLEENLDGARETMRQLEKAGISMTEVTGKLVTDGVQLFAEAFDKLLAAVAKKRQALLNGDADLQTYKLPEAIAAEVKATLEDWRVHGKVRRLWAGDASLWTGDDESKWLGWLGVVEAQLDNLAQFQGVAEDIRRAGFQHALLLGMGGSSLCPEVLKMTFGKIPGFPELHVLDSTDPAQVLESERKVDLAKTVCIVSSKSGSTLEPNIFKQYFFERIRLELAAAPDAAGQYSEWVGGRFLAITDPGSKMQQVAEDDLFRFIFFGLPSIGAATRRCQTSA